MIQFICLQSQHIEVSSILFSVFSIEECPPMIHFISLMLDCIWRLNPLLVVSPANYKLLRHLRILNSRKLSKLNRQQKEMKIFKYGMKIYSLPVSNLFIQTFVCSPVCCCICKYLFLQTHIHHVAGV